MNFSTPNDVTKVLVEKILRQSIILREGLASKWQFQGFGWLRLQLSETVRLHVWDPREAVPNVSVIHDHPWNFSSQVVAGWMHNQRYTIVPHVWGQQVTHLMAPIRPGVNAKLIGEAVPVSLVPSAEHEVIGPGQIYVQRADELHHSMPVPGTVTICDRLRVGEDVARVCWPLGSEFVSAEPRRATPEEVDRIINYSLNKWFTKQ